MKVYQIYFSPTGGAKAVSDIIGNAWTCEKRKIDISVPDEDYTKYLFKEEDICIVSVPSFGGRVPIAAIDRLNKMNGGNAKAILVAVYGNRAFDDTLMELKDTLTAIGFQCIAAIAAVAEHSIIHKYGKGRPDAQDKKQLEEFARNIQTMIEQNEATEIFYVPGSTAYREYHGVPFKPRANKLCASCGLCSTVCPVGAIPEENPSSTDKTKCISCMRCVSICPYHARKINKVVKSIASHKMKKACSQRKRNELFV